MLDIYNSPNYTIFLKNETILDSLTPYFPCGLPASKVTKFVREEEENYFFHWKVDLRFLKPENIKKLCQFLSTLWIIPVSDDNDIEIFIPDDYVESASYRNGQKTTAKEQYLSCKSFSLAINSPLEGFTPSEMIDLYKLCQIGWSDYQVKDLSHVSMDIYKQVFKNMLIALAQGDSEIEAYYLSKLVPLTSNSSSQDS